MATKLQVREAEEARERLREIIQHSDTVYTILRHVSRSGMRREISVRVFVGDDGVPMYLDALVARALGERVGAHQGIIVDGCGMDMGFDLVYRLSIALFCPEKYDHDAAYSLTQRWL